MENLNPVPMANVYYTNRAKGIEKQFYKRMTLDEAYDFCNRPVNCYNYVSNEGYRLEKEEIIESNI